MEHSFIVNVIVKHFDREAARAEVVSRLNTWFAEDIYDAPPRSDGSLLLFTVNDTLFAFFSNDELTTLHRAISAYVESEQGDWAARSLLRRVAEEMQRRVPGCDAPVSSSVEGR